MDNDGGMGWFQAGDRVRLVDLGSPPTRRELAEAQGRHDTPRVVDAWLRFALYRQERGEAVSLLDQFLARPWEVVAEERDTVRASSRTLREEAEALALLADLDDALTEIAVFKAAIGPGVGSSSSITWSYTSLTPGKLDPLATYDRADPIDVPPPGRTLAEEIAWGRSHG